MKQNTTIPIYSSMGDADAFLVFPYLYNRQDEWIGFVTLQREVYSVLGEYVGFLTDDRRILRKRATSNLKPRRIPPAIPPKFLAPPSIPLAPLMKELTNSVIDVLVEEPERLHTLDSGEFKQDMD